jgi:hypothetical protein
VSDLRAELEEACEDLVYSSESDRPFDFFSVPFEAGPAPSIDEFRALMGIDEKTRVETRSLSRFFAAHTDTSDPYDTRAQAIRPRYEALIRVLHSRLDGVQVFRVGKISIDCYIVGGDRAGNLSGLHTVAVET